MASKSCSGPHLPVVQQTPYTQLVYTIIFRLMLFFLCSAALPTHPHWPLFFYKSSWVIAHGTGSLQQVFFHSGPEGTEVTSSLIHGVGSLTLWTINSVKLGQCPCCPGCCRGLSCLCSSPAHPHCVFGFPLSRCWRDKARCRRVNCVFPDQMF